MCSLISHYNTNIVRARLSLYKIIWESKFIIKGENCYEKSYFYGNDISVANWLSN